MDPWSLGIGLGLQMLGKAKAKRDAKAQLRQEILLGRAAELGSSTGAARAIMQGRQIDDQPIVDPSMVANTVRAFTGSDDDEESVEDKVDKAMRRRMEMRYGARSAGGPGAGPMYSEDF